MKTFKGKAIYNPSGKAGEYSYWACNFYNGCSNGCTYCYLKKGVLKPTLGGDKPTLKKCFRNEYHAFEIYVKELIQNKSELQKNGLFFTFTSDPFLPECAKMTHRALFYALSHNIPVKLLTKMNFSHIFNVIEGAHSEVIKNIAIGFTLTGHDELEPNASTNLERIEAMKMLKASGFKTFASIEPIIDFASSKEMIQKTTHYCDLYKIGLESGKKYDKEETKLFMLGCLNSCIPNANKIYFKDSILKESGIEREYLIHTNCVYRDYNLFETR